MRSFGRAALVFAAVLVLVLASSGCSRRDEGKGAGETWFCPMHPEVVADAPGECPICHMSLVPASEGQDAEEAMRAHEGGHGGAAEPAGAGVQGYAPVTIGAEKARLIGLRFGAVTKGPFDAPIRTVGRVDFDETRFHHVHTRYEGYVQEVYADFVGKFVKEGEPLASIYSPDLLATQEEYLLALAAVRDAEGAFAQELADAARRRLLLWEVSPAEIETLERTGEPLETLQLYAPISGVVTARTAYHGMKVGPEDTLFDLADLSRVWVLVDVYEYELPRVSMGQEATMTLPYWPGRTWSGRVSYVFPTVDEKTRTVKVRLEVANREGELKPGMFADVVLAGGDEVALSVPDDAVLDSGTRKIVFVRAAEDRLEPREVVTGGRADGRTKILSGLAEGDSIALGASFLLDSESRLRAAISSARPGESPAAAHGDHQP